MTLRLKFLIVAALGPMILALISWQYGQYPEFCDESLKCTDHNLVSYGWLTLTNFTHEFESFFVVLFTAALAAFTWQLKGSTDRLWKAGEQQRETMIAQARPWLKFSECLLHRMWIDETGTRVEVSFIVENVGNSTATKAEIVPVLLIDAFAGMFTPVVKRDFVIGDGIARGRTVFSGDRWEYRVSFAVSNEVIQADAAAQVARFAPLMAEQPDLPPFRPFPPHYYIVAKVEYQFDGSDLVHATSRRWSIFKQHPDGVSGHGVMFDYTQGEIDLADVSLTDVGEVLGD